MAPQPIVLAPRTYFTQGRPGAIYFDNLTPAARADLYAWDVTGVATGAQLAEGWFWTPGSAAMAALTISTFDPVTGTSVLSAATLVSAAPSTAGAGVTLKAIFVGDSLTNAGVITQTLVDIAAGDVMKLELLGTRGSGANRHEGRGGWTAAAYTTPDYYGPNPFWNAETSSVDFGAYLVTNSIPTPDWVFVLLGTNDVFSCGSDEVAVWVAQYGLDRLDTLIASVKAAGPGVKVGVMTPPPPTADDDLFAASYGSGQTRWRFKRNITFWNREVIARYSGREADRIFVVPVHVSLDTAANMANGVHPAAAGYQQIAESVWAFLKNHAE